MQSRLVPAFVAVNFHVSELYRNASPHIRPVFAAQCQLPPDCASEPVENIDALRPTEVQFAPTFNSGC
jgi:hypothetical protein